MLILCDRVGNTEEKFGLSLYVSSNEVLLGHRLFQGQKMLELLFFFSMNNRKFYCDFVCDAATNHTPHCSGQWGQGEVSAVQEGRSQRDDSAAVHETVNQRHTHKVGCTQTQKVARETGTHITLHDNNNT